MDIPEHLICRHCNMDIRIRNPSGFCDHLYYPEGCLVCQSYDDVQIQKPITVNKEFVDEVIKQYSKMRSNLKLGFGDFYGGPKEIIEEILKRTDNGKHILLMHYNFKNSAFYKENEEKIEALRNE